MRLGAYDCHLAAGQPGRATIYGRDRISERHRHRYEVNINYKERLEAAGLRFSGMSPDGILPEIVELPGSSLVHRRAVPSRAEVEALRAASRCSPPSSAPRSGSRGWSSVSLPSADKSADEFRHSPPRRVMFDRQSDPRQRPAVGADRRPVPARKPRPCAGDVPGAGRDDRPSSASGLIYKSSFDKANRTSRRRRARHRHGEGPADPGRAARDASACRC